ncbi:MAG: phosphatase PAP2 family protein [Ignavibacteriaceae bacterium]
MRSHLVILLIVLISSVLYPQIEAGAEKDFRKFFEVGGDVLTSPKYFQSEDWIKLSATIGITGLAMIIDEDIKYFSQSNKTEFLNNIFKVDDYYHIEFMASSIAVLYLYALIDKNNEVRNLSLRLAESTVYAELINLSIKFISGRSRPYFSESAFMFDPFKFNFDQTSFPSGHSTLAFAYSSVIAKEYNNFLWKLGWYSLAVITAYARVYNNKHWLSDIVLGSAIGLFVGEYVNNHKTNRRYNISDEPVSPPPPIINLRMPL